MLQYHCDKCNLALDITNAGQIGLQDHSALCKPCYEESLKPQTLAEHLNEEVKETPVEEKAEEPVEPEKAV